MPRKVSFNLVLGDVPVSESNGVEAKTIFVGKGGVTFWLMP